MPQALLPVFPPFAKDSVLDTVSLIFYNSLMILINIQFAKEYDD